MKKSFKIAVLGCGWAGLRHARAFLASNAKVSWVVDMNLERATALNNVLNTQARVSANYQDVLADPDVDGVTICLPHDLHMPVAVAAAEAGKHILVEKPIAATLQEADLIIHAARQANVVLMIAENESFRPLTKKIKDLLDDGVIGRLALLTMTRQCYLTRSFLVERPWFLSSKAAAGGMMMSGGVHDFSTARMLLGEVDSVYSLQAPQRFLEMEGDDTSVALVRFKNGVVGTFIQSFIMKSSTTASGTEIHSLRIDGELGSVDVANAFSNRIRVFSEKPGWQPGGDFSHHDIYIPEQDTFQLEIEHFLECIKTNTDPLTHGSSMRKSLEVVLAAYQSMRTGQPVRLPLQPEEA